MGLRRHSTALSQHLLKSLLRGKQLAKTLPTQLPVGIEASHPVQTTPPRKPKTDLLTLPQLQLGLAPNKGFLRSLDNSFILGEHFQCQTGWRKRGQALHQLLKVRLLAANPFLPAREMNCAQKKYGRLHELPPACGTTFELRKLVGDLL
jgi:hypothetical protein